MEKLTLYYTPYCPYCKKVLNFLEDKNVEIELKNINEDIEAKKELKEEGGKSQVPCLFIEGDPLYESDDIVKWFEENIE